MNIIEPSKELKVLLKKINPRRTRPTSKTGRRPRCPFLKGFRCNAKKGYIPYGRHLKKFCLGSWKKYELCKVYINEVKSRIARRSVARQIGYAGGRDYYILDKKKIKRSLRT